MVALITPTPAKISRLTSQSLEIAADTFTLRCLDWDRDRFDIEFALENGTTYNSFVIKGEKTALIDTSHRKFAHLYLEQLSKLIDLNNLDYLIISHSEPDHSGLVKEVLQLVPEVTVVGAKVAMQFLENMVHRPFKQLIVKSGDQLDLGNGHLLEFVSAPNLHWPDTIFTYDAKTRTLFTCDAFGMHFCDDQTYDREKDWLEADFQTYYDCLMRPNARSVLGAIKRIEKFDIALIATGHGPLLKHYISHWIDRYQTWSQEQTSADTLVAVFFTQDYGQSEHLASIISQGLTKTGVVVELVDLNNAAPQEVRELINQSRGVVIGMPPQSSALGQTILSTILASVHSKQAVGLFESGGGEDEPIFPLRNKFQEIGVSEAFPPLLVKETPNQSLDLIADEAGIDLGQLLNRERTIKQIKSINNELERALGRLSNGLYLITAQKADLSSAMLASWVTQASLNPFGVAISVAKDRAMVSFLQPTDTFVLNVLAEDNYQGLMKHFLKRFPPGANRFEGVKTYTANNGSPILADALAYLECEVTSRMDCGDHWVVYCTVHTGRVARLDTLTAVHHRKVGNHY
jgi:flavorubredoxin/flavin reductase (DIM6/NTAB) family NADH-FMN oxidoreductase RutF